MAYPTPAAYQVNQGFRSYATAGVVGRPDGTEIQYLVWLYGDYQRYGHAGADIACPIGTPVYAIADGVVVWAGWGEDLPGDESWGPGGYFKRWGMYKNFPGICTVIWHPHLNKFSIYGHQSSNDEVSVGQQVREGQLIGKSGNTKTRRETVGPHLHIAVVGDFTTYSTGGKYIFGCEDPVPYFNTGSLSYASSETITPITPIQEDEVSAEDVFTKKLTLKNGAESTFENQVLNISDDLSKVLQRLEEDRDYAQKVNGKIDALFNLLTSLPAEIMDKPITTTDGKETTLATELKWLPANFAAAQKEGA